ncbi:MAG: hypothetical protein ACRCYO_10510 [Bacteroidia bacterium]
MNYCISLIIVCFTATFLHAQDSIQTLTRYKQGQVNESYWRLPTGEKHGTYKRYTRYGNTYISGQYDHGKPIGIWELYKADSSKKLVQRLNFDTHQELFLDSANFPTLFCGPRFFGGNMLQNEYIDRAIKTQFTEAERQALKGKSILVAFSIDQQTLKPINIKVATAGIDLATQKKLVAIVETMPVWLPAIPRAGTCVWEFSVPFLF